MNLKIKLIKSAFYKEKETKEGLAKFVASTSLFSMGEECRKFEENFAKKQGRKFSVFVSSGSSANLVLVQSLLNLGRLKKNDRIGFSALTWSTNIMPLIQLGLTPVPIDCSLRTLNVSPLELEKYAQGLKGLFLTNVLGFCDDIEKISEICKAHDLVFFEDNCESLGSSVNGKLLGNFGEASTFSFFVGHHLSTIEGGMICTDDEELHDMLLLTRIHGWDRNLSEIRQKKIREKNQVDDFYAKYTFYDLAYNARPTEINGFLGNSQLPYLDEIVFKREGNFKLFHYVSKKNDDFYPSNFSHMDTVSNFAYPLIMKDEEKTEKYKSRFLKNGVEMRPIIAGSMVRQPFYRKYITEHGKCENADFIHDNGLYFGNNPEMTQSELEELCRMMEK